MTLVVGGGSLSRDADPLAPHRFGRTRFRHHLRRGGLAPDVPVMTERLHLTTTDGATLEARWDSHDQPKYTTVFCHPSPIEGGSMMAPLMIAVTQKLVSRGHAVLRFNFRGVGGSTGTYDEGRAELSDVTAAMEVASARSATVGIAGWSFGAAIALNWLTGERSDIPYVGIAPPPRLITSKPPNGPKRIILGTREQVIDAENLKRFCIDNGIDLILTPGDHFFHGRGKRIGNLVGEGLEGRD